MHDTLPIYAPDKPESPAARTNPRGPVATNMNQLATHKSRQSADHA